ncbi:MAG TPA: PepSY-associated TM helix domain-containing protein [Candidatus Sulfotelmatobacter sp.]|nr:PepSY-associated TM helix domain-containing protein [Candidatus Sulfotelmatobacter sp.]
MNLRKLIFWCHLTVGSIAGVVILAMCVTGVLLAFEGQIISFAERGFRVDPPADAHRLSLEPLLEKAHAQPNAPMSIVWRADPSAPVEIAPSRNQVLLLNPYSGTVLGEGATRTRAFFHSVEDVHRWLAASPENRATGRAITAARNLGFLFLVCSGPFLWLPRTWTCAAVRAGTRFKFSLRGKARDFNWHNVIGFWICIPLAVIVLCAVVMSYPWVNNLVYRVTGNPPPPNGPQIAAGHSQPNTQRNRNRETPLASVGNEDVIAASWSGLNALSHRAEQRVPEWRTITARLTSLSDADVTFSIDSGNGGRPDKRAQLTLDRKTAAEIRWEPFSSYNSGRQLRAWIRFTHTGEAGGALGQSVASIAAAGGAVLVWTGLSLAIRRLLASISGSRNTAERAANRAPLPKNPPPITDDSIPLEN